MDEFEKKLQGLAVHEPSKELDGRIGAVLRESSAAEAPARPPGRNPFAWLITLLKTNPREDRTMPSFSKYSGAAIVALCFAIAGALAYTAGSKKTAPATVAGEPPAKHAASGPGHAGELFEKRIEPGEASDIPMPKSGLPPAAAAAFAQVSAGADIVEMGLAKQDGREVFTVKVRRPDGLYAYQISADGKVIQTGKEENLGIVFQDEKSTGDQPSNLQERRRRPQGQ